VNITTASAALTDETAYDVYLVAEDKATIDGVDMRNVQTEVVKLTFTTRDVTAPTFAAGYPKVDTAPEKLTVTAKLNEAGDVYFVVVADGDAAPTVDEAIAGSRLRRSHRRGAVREGHRRRDGRPLLSRARALDRVHVRGLRALAGDRV
jgi:hypothetical protein